MSDRYPQRIITRFLSYLFIILKKNPFTARVIEAIWNNSLYKSVLILGSGTIIAQLVGLASMPIITRIYIPSDMGILAVYSSILAIVGIVSTFSYQFAFPLPKKDEDAINLFGLCMMLLFTTTMCFALILFFGSKLMIHTFNLGIIEQFNWLLLLGFFGMGLYTILNYWAIRQRDYERITYTKINQGAGGSICKIVLGILSFGPMGLIMGHLVSQIAGIGTLSRAMWKKDRENFKSLSLNRMKRIAQKYKSFPEFNFPASIVNTISLQIPPLMMLALFNSEIVGFYALASSIMVLPGSVISGSMGLAYFGEASKMVRDGSKELRSLYIRTLRHLTLIAIPLFCTVAFCAPYFIPIIFGEAWMEAGVFCLPMLFWIISAFVVSPTSWLEIYDCNHWVLIWDIARVAGVLFGFYVSQLFRLSPLMVIWIYSLIMTTMYLVYILMNLKAIDNLNRRNNTIPS